MRKELRLSGSLHVIDGGDHSFQLPAARAKAQRATMDAAADAIAKFVRAGV